MHNHYHPVGIHPGYHSTSFFSYPVGDEEVQTALNRYRDRDENNVEGLLADFLA
jgi:hypothetical protein